MATINEVLLRTDELRANAFSAVRKGEWLISLEGRLSLEVLGQATQVQAYPADGDRALCAPAPFDRLYDLFLAAMMNYYDGEYDAYANDMALFNAAYDEWRCYDRRMRMPLQNETLKAR